MTVHSFETESLPTLLAHIRASIGEDAEILDILPDPARLTKAGPLVLMGPTGVGKSSLGAIEAGECDRAARTFMQAGALDLVVTKTDTVRRLGSLAAAAPGLRLAGHTEDPAILSGFKPPSQQILVDRLTG
ncbi:hypothetical protein CKO28_05090 [Rhodovibrio sodomensis]|uniref:Uncharacterized protein n=1 Tax=Rhodovibrio sodomensis TaxID=1088 RepID=A0ABS1DAD9_9PROT|nr:hypothetical protein [Rhodovibrio sodomensis]MBK1667404.1 hypothetical protein [Rhodovibrio sodomensis]